MARTWTDEIVDALRALGGKAHYDTLYEYIQANTDRKPLPPQWQAIIRNAIEKHSSDTTCSKPKNFDDLFYAVDGIGNGVWGLREQKPVHYLQYWKRDQIVREMAREASGAAALRVIGGNQLRKMRLADTVWIIGLNEQRRLVLYGRLIVGRLCSQDDVEAILGRRPEFKANVYAIARRGTEMPMHSLSLDSKVSSVTFTGSPKQISVAPDGTINAQQLQSIRRLSGASAALLESLWLEGSMTSSPEKNEMFQEPEESEIDEGRPPEASQPSDKKLDQEARCQALDQRVYMHWELVCAIKSRARAAGYVARKTQYIDVVTYRQTVESGAVIIEVKSLDGDDADQTRRAIGQLILYRFLHRKRYGNAALVVAFNRKPVYRGLDLTKCLDECGIGTIWLTQRAAFEGTPLGVSLLPWLVTQERAA